MPEKEIFLIAPIDPNKTVPGGIRSYSIGLLEKISERKRKIIGNYFIKVFENQTKKMGNFAFLAQGTLYPDLIESVSVKGPSVTIKSHHNVGGLPKKMKLKLVEPLKFLFKDEVREIGRKMGLIRLGMENGNNRNWRHF